MQRSGRVYRVDVEDESGEGVVVELGMEGENRTGNIHVHMAEMVRYAVGGGLAVARELGWVFAAVPAALPVHKSAAAAWSRCQSLIVAGVGNFPAPVSLPRGGPACGESLLARAYPVAFAPAEREIAMRESRVVAGRVGRLLLALDLEPVSVPVRSQQRVRLQ